MINYSELKEDIEFIFKDFIEFHSFKVDMSDGRVTLSNDQCIIEIIYQRYDGVEAWIVEPNSNFRATPLAWEVFVNGGKNRIPMQVDIGFDSERDRIKCFLYMIQAGLMLYCQDLLDGDFSMKSTYLEGQKEQQWLFDELNKLDKDDPIYIGAMRTKSNFFETSWMDDLKERLKNQRN